MLTFECDPGKYREIGDPNKQKYCDKHGYDFLSYTEPLSDRHPGWEKFLYIDKVLNETDYDWVFWVDYDAFIINSDIRIENFIHEDKDLVICHDDIGINSGVELVKNSEWSKWLYKDAWDYEKYGNDHDNMVTMTLGPDFGKLEGRKSTFAGLEQSNLQTIIGQWGETFPDNVYAYKEEQYHFNVRPDRATEETYIVHYRRGWRAKDGYGHVLDMIY